MSALEPRRRQIQCHLELLMGRPSAMADLRLEIAWGGPEHGPRSARLFRIADLNQAATFAAQTNESGCNVYVGMTLKSADTPRNRRSSAKDAVLATCLAIDIDRHLIEGARQLPRNIKPQLLVLSGRRPALRGHLWIGLQPTTDLDMLEVVSGRVIACCRGDMAARGRGVLMRLAGTVSYPSEKKKQSGYCIELVTGHFIDAPTYSLAALAAKVPRQRNGFELDAHRFADQRNLAAVPSGDIQVVQAALEALPDTYADTYDLWIRVGLALHAFDPSIRGLLLWRQFSDRCRQKAALTDFEYRWATFGRRSTGRQITIRWLLGQARNQGWRQTCEPNLRRVRRR